jgi:5'-nucleotidase
MQGCQDYGQIFLPLGGFIKEDMPSDVNRRRLSDGSMRLRAHCGKQYDWNRRMNILLTNDDGIEAAGINSLFEILSEKNNTFMVAPASEKSACSNAITVRTDVKIKKISDNKFAIDGYPADCVNIGLHGGIIPRVDLVISGINHGPNLGDDVFFSGTVAAARSAFIFGVSGIAFSIDSIGGSRYFDDASRFMLGFIGDLNFGSSDARLCLNVNYPDLPAESVAGVKYTSLCKREYRDSYRVMHSDKNELTLRLDGTIFTGRRDGTDFDAVKNSYISVTPLTLDCTDYSYLDRMSGIKC